MELRVFDAPATEESDPMPGESAEVWLGSVRVLETLKRLRLNEADFYQASSV